MATPAFERAIALSRAFGGSLYQAGLHEESLIRFVAAAYQVAHAKMRMPGKKAVQMYWAVLEGWHGAVREAREYEASNPNEEQLAGTLGI